MTKKILVVDDEDDTRQAVKTLLEREGFHVNCVGTAIDCLNEVKKNKYHLILLDIFLPDKDGETLLKELRSSINHSTPMVYITMKPKGDVDLTDADGFIAKPFKNEELIKIVKQKIKKSKNK